MRLVVRAWREERRMVGTHAPSGCRYLEYLQENRTADRAGWAAGRRGRLGTDCLPTMLHSYDGAAA
jgi:hypothetical protein